MFKVEINHFQSEKSIQIISTVKCNLLKDTQSRKTFILNNQVKEKYQIYSYKLKEKKLITDNLRNTVDYKKLL